MNFRNILILGALFYLVGIISCQKKEDSIFILPEGYTGYVLIVYNQETGIPRKYVNDSRVYEVPSNGILLSQFKANDGWGSYPKFYYGEMNGENEIQYILDRDIFSEDIIVCGGGSGTANKDLEGKERIKFSQYFIGTSDQIDEAYKEFEKLDIASLVP